MLFIIMVTIIIIVRYTYASEKSQNLLEVCLFMPYLQSLNDVLMLGEDGKQGYAKENDF